VTPTVLEPDYAEWMLDDPRVNFAISTRGGGAGLDHLGLQVDSREGLAAVAGRPAAAGHEVAEQTAATCCYARSDKTWVRDPAGIAWETFHTFGAAAEYGEDMAAPAPRARAAAKSCCTPAGAAASCCAA